MEETKKILIMMAEYHQWAYEQIFSSLKKLPNELYFDRSVKLFFGSVHGGFNHLCLVDRLWLGRFIGENFSVQSLDQEIYQNRDELQRAILLGANQWVAYIKNISSKELNKPKIYKNTKGIENQFLPATTLLHVFNHGTHHRGQITAALTSLGYNFEPLDLFYSPMYKAVNDFE